MARYTSTLLAVFAFGAAPCLAQGLPFGPVTSEAVPYSVNPSPAIAFTTVDEAMPVERIWGDAEYLLWWVRSSQLPPLVTTAPVGGAGIPGALGSPGTTTIIGGNSLNDESRSGGRLRVGAWIDSARTIGIEGVYFFLNDDGRGQTAGGSGAAGTPVVGRPFFNVLTGAQDVQYVAYPGLLAGSTNVSLSNQLQGAELNGIWCVCRNSNCDRRTQVDLIGGFRYLSFDEKLSISENLNVLPQPQFAGARIALVDQFDTRNQFYGGQIGLRGERSWRRVFVNVQGKVALGSMSENVTINGGTRIDQIGGAVTLQNGGLLAQPTNTGSYSRDVFAVVPEFDLNVGYQVTSRLRVFVGYSFLYCSNIARSANQINTSVNPNQLVPGQPLTGPSQPAFTFRDTDFWAQGINFGVQFRF